MRKGQIEVTCPCCEAVLKIDVETQSILTHRIPEKPKPIEDLAAEVEKLKGASSRREEVFQKNVAAERVHTQVLSKKFDELFKQAKENPDLTPPQRDIDLD